MLFKNLSSSINLTSWSQIHRWQRLSKFRKKMFIIFTVCSGCTLNLDKKQNLTYLVVLRRNCQYHRKSRSLLSNFKERQQNRFFSNEILHWIPMSNTNKGQKALNENKEGCMGPIFAHSSRSSLGILSDITHQIPKYSRLFCTSRLPISFIQIKE